MLLVARLGLGLCNAPRREELGQGPHPQPLAVPGNGVKCSAYLRLEYSKTYHLFYSVKGF